MHDVGVVPGDLCTNGRAINSAGQAIGTSTDCMGHVEHMFLWQNGTIHDLTAMILPGSDIYVFEAWDINDFGEIAAVGRLPNGDQHAVLLIPASAEEIAAAANLPAANTSNSSRRPVTTSADLPPEQPEPDAKSFSSRAPGTIVSSTGDPRCLAL